MDDRTKIEAPAEPGRTLKLLPAISPRWASREEQACGYECRCCVTALQRNYFFARLVLLAREVLAITAFLAVRLRAVFLVARLRAGFFATFLVALRAVVLRAVLRAVEVLAFADLRAAFLAGFFAAFFVAMVRLSSSSVGSGCPVNACRNASHKRSLFVACRRLDT